MHCRTVLLGLALLFSCAVSPAQPSEGILRIGDRPPAFDCTTYKTHEAPDWARLQGRVVIVEFWATWCPPCIKDIPRMNELVEAFRGKPVTFISVTYENEGMVGTFLRKHPMESVVGLDNDFAMFRSFKAWGIPMAVIVDKGGRIAGVTHPDHLSEGVVRDVLNGKMPDVPPAQAWPDPAGAEKYFRSLMER